MEEILHHDGGSSGTLITLIRVTLNLTSILQMQLQKATTTDITTTDIFKDRL